MNRHDEPDPRRLWGALGESIRPWAGWITAVVGIVALTLGYLGVSREILVAKQLPYVVSGGLAGIALVFIGGVLLGTQDVRRQGQRLEVLERQVQDLHDVLLVSDTSGASGSTSPTDTVEQHTEQHTEQPDGAATG